MSTAGFAMRIHLCHMAVAIHGNAVFVASTMASNRYVLLLHYITLHYRFLTWPK